MEKEIIDLTANPPSSPPSSSKTKKDPKLKISTSSKRTQFKNKKCARRSKPQMPNLNYYSKNLYGQTYGFSETPQALAAAICRLHVARPKTSILQRGLDLLEPLTIPKNQEPIQLGHFAWNKPPQVDQYYAADFLNNLSTTCLYQYSASTSYYSNSMMKNTGPPQTIKFLPDAIVNNSTSAFKGLEKKTVDAGATTRTSKGDVDLELRLCSNFKLDN